jgi:hypothetical protein
MKTPRAQTPPPAQARTTILVICTGLVLLHVLFAWPWAVYAALGLGVLGILSDAFSRAVAAVWLAVAHAMNAVMATLLLSVLFYVVLAPIALLSRLFTKDPLMLGKHYDTYFVAVDKAIDKESLTKPW